MRGSPRHYDSFSGAHESVNNVIMSVKKSMIRITMISRHVTKVVPQEKSRIHPFGDHKYFKPVVEIF